MAEGTQAWSGGDVVVGVDGSPSSRAAAEWAAQYVEKVGGVLALLATWDWPQTYGWAVPLPSDYDPANDARQLADEIAAGLRHRHPGVQVVARTVQGHPAPALVDASRDAALLVIGSRGHGEFTGMLLGSVSEHCVTHAHCPVLVMRMEKPGG